MKKISLVFILIFFTMLFVIDLKSLATQMNLDHQNLPPFSSYVFGTDDLGRSLFWRLLYGLKISLLVGVCATFFDIFIGASLGCLSALLPKPVSKILDRFFDVMTILPQMLLSMLILMIIKNGLLSLILAIAATGWLPTARAMRAEILKLKKLDFILALKGFGFSKTHIFFKHVLPSCYGTLLVSSALCLPSAIFSEAFMSFLGLGVPPPYPSLGNMIQDGLGALRYYPWRLIFPACLIFCLVFSLFTFVDHLKKRMQKYL